MGVDQLFRAGYAHLRASPNGGSLNGVNKNGGEPIEVVQMGVDPELRSINKRTSQD